MDKNLDMSLDKILDGVLKAKDSVVKAKNEIANDIKVIRERDPAATSNIEVALLYSGFHAVLAYRLSHKLYKHNNIVFKNFISRLKYHN